MKSTFMVLTTLALLALVPAWAESSDVSGIASTDAQGTQVSHDVSRRFVYSHETPMECYACHYSSPDVDGNGHGGRASKIVS